LISQVKVKAAVDVFRVSPVSLSSCDNVVDAVVMSVDLLPKEQ
jgi:hypothetical protein